MDKLTQKYDKARYQLYKESQKNAMKKWREKQLSREVGENHKCCTRCYSIKPISDYGEYKQMVVIDGTCKLQEAMVPYNSCKACRDKDKLRVVK